MFRRCICILFLFALLNSCKTDFPLNAPYKQIDVIYALLDNASHNDTLKNANVQYIKINKAFQNTGNTNANTLAGNPDTTNITDSLYVTLQPYRNGAPTHAPYVLYKIDSIAKNPGLFSNPLQYLWRTPAGFVLDANATYILLVKDITTGNKDSASTSVVQTVSPVRYPFVNSDLDFTRNLGALLVEFNPAANAVEYNLTLELFYTETKKANHQNINHKELDWPIYADQPASTITFQNIKGRDFYNFLGRNIAKDTTVLRHFDSVYVVIQAAGQELFNYIDANTPGIGVVQKTLNYTNVHNGAGIFSSRCTDVVRMLPGSALQKALPNDSATAGLGFK